MQIKPNSILVFHKITPEICRLCSISKSLTRSYQRLLTLQPFLSFFLFSLKSIIQCIRSHQRVTVNKPITSTCIQNQSRSDSISRVLVQISQTGIFIFNLRLKLSAVHIRKKNLMLKASSHLCGAMRHVALHTHRKFVRACGTVRCGKSQLFQNGSGCFLSTLM